MCGATPLDPRVEYLPRLIGWFGIGPHPVYTHHEANRLAGGINQALFIICRNLYKYILLPGHRVLGVDIRQVNMPTQRREQFHFVDHFDPS